MENDFFKQDLYARDIKGNIKHWSIESDRHCPVLIIRSGIINHVHINTEISQDGLSFEEVNKILAKRIAKRKEGYVSLKDLRPDAVSFAQFHPNIEVWLKEHLPKYNSDANNNLKPMKCQKFRENIIKYPALAQFKLNGLRCVLKWEEIKIDDGLFTSYQNRAVLRSKEGHEYYMPHITNNLKFNDFINNGIDMVYDGELYIHGKSLSYIKASCPMILGNGTLTKSKNNSEAVSFNSFDLAIPDILQADRTKMLEDSPIFERGVINLVKATLIYNDEEALEFRDAALRLGYEGCVIRELNEEYAFGFRPRYIRKYKTFIDNEFLIVRVEPRPTLSDLPLFILKNDINDELFECIPIGTFENQAELLKNAENLIGKYATVRYRERSGVSQVPFHANIIDFRQTKLEDID